LKSAEYVTPPYNTMGNHKKVGSKIPPRHTKGFAPESLGQQAEPSSQGEGRPDKHDQLPSDIASGTVSNNGYRHNGPMFAYVDSGTSIIGMAPSLSNAINRYLGFDEVDASGVFFTKQCDCVKQARVVINITNFEGVPKSFVLNSADYSSQYLSDTSSPEMYCYSSFETVFPADEENSIGNLIILGDTFLRKFYSVYDNSNPQMPSVGLMLSSDVAPELLNAGSTASS